MSDLRKKDRAMPEAETLETLRSAMVGRLGLCRDDQPYIVPLNFDTRMITSTLTAPRPG